MSATARWFGASVVTATAALFLVGAGQHLRDEAAAQLQRGTTVAYALAWVAAQELSREPPEDTALVAFTHALPSRVAGVERALVLQKTRLLAHTDPASEGRRLDRESVADKELYDRAASLERTVQKNAEERERDPARARAAYAELATAELAGGSVRFSAPIRLGARVLGLAEVELRPVAPTAGLPLALPGIALLVIALFSAISAVAKGALGGTPGKLAAALVLGGVIAGEAYALVLWRDGTRETYARGAAALHGELVQAGLLSAGGTRPEDAIAIDAYGTRAGAIVAITTSSTRAADPVLRDSLELDAGGTKTYVSRAELAALRARDVRHAAQWAGAIALLALVGYVLGVLGQLGRAGRSLWEHRSAYLYLSPALAGLAILVFIPVVFGVVVGFMRRSYNVWELAGLDNYLAILGDLDVSNPQNFYFKLGVTAMWTVVNVSFHVGIGLFLALLLNDPMLAARGVYRVLLIVPWAIPNYITALIWRGMFHKQFGAVNFFLDALGVEPIAWFQTFWPAFSTNVVTNVWLGFPFMMVISLGALQSIPADLYEAAHVDGARRWQRFRHITLPLLMPALVPAVIVGTIWTFNMFNIIYLVSGGAPNGATDILITDAFRWAFERDAYGYAAAYSTLIFLILLVFSLATNRITGATKGVFE